MADKPKTAGKPAESTPGAQGAWTPAQWDAFYAKNGLALKSDDMKIVGGITPIYASKDAIERGWPPLVGLLLGVAWLHFEKEKIPEQRDRAFFVVEVAADTFGIEGTGADRKPVERKKGEWVLMPISGAIKNIRDLQEASVDPVHMRYATFQVTGEREDIGRPEGQEMWPITAHLVGAPQKRELPKHQVVIRGVVPAHAHGTLLAGGFSTQALPSGDGQAYNSKGQAAPAVG